MILIELVGGEPKRVRLEFHPLVTVVAGLSSEQRRDLASAIAKTLCGNNAGIDVTVDVDGEPQPLSKDLIARLGLARMTIDNVIRDVDLPGATVSSVSSSTVVYSPSLESASSQAMAPVDIARAELQALQKNLEDLESRLERVASSRSVADLQRIEELKVQHSEARARTTEARQSLNTEVNSRPPSLSPGERLARARRVKENLEARIHQLGKALQPPAVELELVEELLVEARAAATKPVSVGESSIFAGHLADEWAALTVEFERLARRPKPPAWLVNQSRDQLEEAQARVKALSFQLSEGIEVGPPLERAQHRLVEAQMVWAELQVTGEEELSNLQEREALVRTQASEILGREVDPLHIEGALRAHQQQVDAVRDPRDELAELLLEAGLGASISNSIAVAEKWLNAQRNNIVQRPRIQREIASITLNIEEISTEITGLESGGEVEEETDRVVELEVHLRACESAQAAISAQLLALDADDNSVLSDGDKVRLEESVKETREQVEAAGRKVDYFARLEALRGDAVKSSSAEADENAVPWWEGSGGTSSPSSMLPQLEDLQADLSRVSVEDLELFVLSRAAGLRRMGIGESVPLIIDSAFDKLSPDVLSQILGILPRIAPIVQVIYLASNDLVEKWAKRQPELIAAVVWLERA